MRYYIKILTAVQNGSCALRRCGSGVPGFGASKTKDASPGRPLDLYVILDFRILG